MALVRWEPFRELATLEGRVNRLFNDVWGQRGTADPLIARGAWTPAVDIFENDDALVIKAELPDLKREEIDLTVEDHVLTLRGERKFEQEVRDDQVHRIERSYGQFCRSFTLPATVDASKVSAEYRDGVLTIRLTRREEAKPRQIPVEAA